MNAIALTRLMLVPLVLCACAVAQTPSKWHGTLKLRVTDGCGRTAHEWQVLEFRDEKGHDLKRAFHGDRASDIPYGNYKLRVWGGAFFPYEGTVEIRQPETLYLVGLTFAGLEYDPPSFEVRGRFEAPPGRGAWCKLSGVYTRDGHFAAVQPDGTFVFPFVLVASYILVCQQDSEILALQPVEMCPGRSLDIVLPAAGTAGGGSASKK